VKPVPQELLARLAELTPPGSEIIPLDWAYEDEDHNIAVLVDAGEDARMLEDRLSDAIIEYDEAHGTFTIAMVWPKREKAAAGVR
jgi:hypothetical protein